MDLAWEEAAKSFIGEKSLQRVADHQKNVLSTVSTVGTLLTGFGAVTAAVTVDSDTYTVWGIPLVPAGALLATTVAAVAVMVALVARRPRFFSIQPARINEVEDWFNAEVERGRIPTLVSSGLLIAAAGVAAITALVSGLFVLADPDPTPINHAVLSTSAGKDGPAGHLGGSMSGVGEDQAVTVSVWSMPPTAGTPEAVGTFTAFPDEDGTVSFDESFAGFPEQNGLSATIAIREFFEEGHRLEGDMRTKPVQEFEINAAAPAAIGPP